MRQLIFAGLLLAATIFFSRTMSRYLKVMMAGRPDWRPRFDQIPKRLLMVLIYFLGQKKVAEKQLPPSPPSWHHLFIFWGFLVITAGTAEVIVAGLFPSFTLEMLMGATLYTGLKYAIDLFNLLVLVMVGYAFFRRIVVQPRLIPMNLDAGLILGAIAGLMITHYGWHTFHALSLGQTEIHAGPVSSTLADMIARAGGPRGESAAVLSEISYWVHVVIVFAFLNYLPYSKHIHLLGALPNILTMRLDDKHRFDMPKVDLEDETQWGVGKYEQFTWKQLLDTYACTECARCSNYCPANATGKPLSPMELIHDIRYEMLDVGGLRADIEALEKKLSELPPAHDDHGHGNGHDAHAAHADGHDDHGHHDDGGRPDLPEHPERDLITTKIAAAKMALEKMPQMVGGRIKEETLWACTMCGACQEACPVFIEHPAKILQMRQNLVLSQEKVPADLARTFRNIERNSNPWGIGADKRMEWAEGLGVPTIEEHPQPEYILWVGCAGAFDQRIRKQTQAMVRLLKEAGVDYAVLGHKEQCTGDPAKRGGNEMLFQMQAEANVATLNEAKAKKVITSCPHCLHTLRQDYPQFGGNYDVIHHTQLLNHLMEEGKLPTPTREVEGSVVFHDSCYLGRWNGEFEAPRAVLKRLPVIGGVLDPVRSKEKGFCCGAGGGRMFMEEHGERVNSNRTKELVATGASTIAVACPFCTVMLTDGVKELDKEDGVRVLDLAELLAESLPQVHAIRESVPVPPQPEDGPMGPVGEGGDGGDAAAAT